VDLTLAQRSRIMRSVKGRNTAPEMVVRRLAHSLGYRFRLHRAELPGKPDLTFVSRQAVIMVNGCFWHGHNCKRGARVPKTNTNYWKAKISRNAKRDKKNLALLKRNGWKALVVWECEMSDQRKLSARLRRFLG